MTLATASTTIRRRPSRSREIEQQAVAMARPRLRAVVRRARLPRLADLPHRAADSRSRSRRPTARCCSPASRSSDGQQAWLSAGGQQLGTVWGHGSYVAPDWSADWLHREAVGAAGAARAGTAQGHGDARPADRARRVDAAREGRDAPQHLRRRDRHRHGVATSAPQAIREVARHYEGLFGDRAVAGHAARPVRDDAKARCPTRPTARRSPPSSSGPPGPRPPTGPARPASRTPATGRTSRWWATRCRPRPRCGRWSASSCCWPASPRCSGCTARTARGRGRSVPQADPLLGAVATPSMKATRKYFFVGHRPDAAADRHGRRHRALRGRGPVASSASRWREVLPYVVSRTVHTQLGIFWIATAWLATGLYIAPLLVGPRAQVPEARRRRAVLGADRRSSSARP